MIEGRREEVDVGRPTVKKIANRLRTQRSLGPQDLRSTAEQIRQNIQMAWNELGKEPNGMNLAKPEKLLSDCIQGGRTSAPLVS